MGPAPAPVKARPARSADPEAYDGGWVTQPDAGPILRQNLAKRLAADGIAPAQKSTAHAPVDHVVPRRVGQRDEGGAGAGHRGSLERYGNCVN